MKNKEKLITLNCLFCVCLIVSNILASKILSIWRGKFVIPAAVICYPITFLITDIIGEIWGKKEANNTVKNGFICQVISIILIFIAIQFPVADFADNQAAFKEILSGGIRITLASLTAYVISQKWDVFIFHRLKSKNGKKWIRNNVSTITSQAIDTAIFITIAFYGAVPNIWVMIYSQYVVKIILALLDTPFFYIFTKQNLKGECNE